MLLDGVEADIPVAEVVVEVGIEVESTKVEPNSVEMLGTEKVVVEV